MRDAVVYSCKVRFTFWLRQTCWQNGKASSQFKTKKIEIKKKNRDGYVDLRRIHYIFPERVAKR